MTRRYTLTDCYELLQVDPKTFRRWIEKAGIVPQVSKADDRVKYLTQEQLEELAALHERLLPQTIPHEDATLAPGTYKLLVDQLDDLQRQVAHLATLAQQMNTSFPAQLAEQRSTLETTRVSLDTFHVLVDHRLEETRQTIDDRLRQHEEQQQELTALLNSQEAAHSDHRQELEARLHHFQQDLQAHKEQSASALEQHGRTLQETLYDELQRAISQQCQEHAATILALLGEERRSFRETTDSLTAQMNTLTVQFAPLLENQQVAEQKITDLERMLIEERQARETLASHVATLAKRRQPTKTPKPAKESTQ